MSRLVRRGGRTIIGRMVMGIWVVLPLIPVMAALCTWLLGVG